MIRPSLLYGESEGVSRWVADRIPYVGKMGFGESKAIGIVTDRLIAGVVFHDYQPLFGTIQLSIAAESPMWARKAVIGEFLRFPFIQLNCFKVWTAIPSFNEAALRVNEKAGFKREATLAHHFGERAHAVISRMLRPRYLRLYESVTHG